MMEIRIIVISAVVQVILSSNLVVAEDDVYYFKEEFEICHNGQSTGFKAFIERNSWKFAGCIVLLTTSTKYCFLKCSFEKYGTIGVHTGKPNIGKVNEFVDEFPKFPEREDLRNASISCITKPTYPDCRSVQQWFTCFYNEFNRICRKKILTQDWDTSSEGVLTDLGLK